MELIYNQHEIPKQNLRYGFRSSAATGCGWIAVYNALCILGNPMEPKKLIRKLERMFPLIHGNAGTFVLAPAILLRRMGYSVKMCFCRRKFDERAKAARVCILFYYWRSGWRIGAHLVALHHTESGFVGYNTYRNSHGADSYGSSLTAFLKRHHYFGCVLISVKNKK